MRKNIKTFIFILFIIFYFSTCASAGVAETDTVAIASAGGNAIGHLESINNQLANIIERERNELARIANTSNDLKDTIRQIIEFAFGLLDQIEGVRNEISNSDEMGKASDNNPSSMDSLKNN